MSSNVSSTEAGVSSGSPSTARTVRERSPRTRFDVERKLLCDRIEQLERELAREQRRREQVVDQYERLLDEQRRENDADGGWLRGLF